MKIAFLAGALALGLAPAAANATLQLKISDGATTETVIDSSGSGMVYYNGTVGAFTIVVSTGLDERRLGVSSTPGIDLSSIELSGSAGGALTVSLTETGITGSGPVTFGAQVGGTITGARELTYSAYMDAGNTAFGAGALLGAEGFTSTPFKGSFGASVSPGALYSMTEVIRLDAAGPSLASFDAELRVPEPMSLAILGAGLVGMGAISRRRPTPATC